MEAEKDFEKILYESLPPVYRKRDDNEELKRFLKIFADASEDFYEEVYEYDNLFNIDNVDPVILPYIADTLGFVFPYDLDIEEQRKFLKALPDLYKQKGTMQVFQYLALEVFNWESEISTNEFIHPDTGASIINIDVTVLADHSSSLPDKLTHYVDRFTDFAELFRPVNNKITTILKYVYQDGGYLRENYSDTLHHDSLFQWFHLSDTRSKLSSRDIGDISPNAEIYVRYSIYDDNIIVSDNHNLNTTETFRDEDGFQKFFDYLFGI